MQITKSKVGFGIIFFAILTTKVAMATPPTYPLICVGSAQNFVVATFSGGRFGVSVTYNKWNRPASPSMPAGYCSWRDRGMNNNEPSQITYFPDSKKGFFTLSFSPGRKTGNISAIPPCIGACGDYDMNTALLGAVITDGKSGSFQVFNDNDGSMIFTP